MKDLIDKLHEFAKQDFPVADVTAYLEAYEFKMDDREKYCFF